MAFAAVLVSVTLGFGAAAVDLLPGSLRVVPPDPSVPGRSDTSVPAVPPTSDEVMP